MTQKKSFKNSITPDYIWDLRMKLMEVTSLLHNIHQDFSTNYHQCIRLIDCLSIEIERIAEKERTKEF